MQGASPFCTLWKTRGVRCRQVPALSWGTTDSPGQQLQANVQAPYVDPLDFTSYSIKRKGSVNAALRVSSPSFFPPALGLAACPVSALNAFTPS